MGQKKPTAVTAAGGEKESDHQILPRGA